MPHVEIETSTQTPKRKPKKQPEREKDPLRRMADRLARRGKISEKAMARLRAKAGQKATA